MSNPTPVVLEIPLHATDHALTAWNAPLADQMFFAIVKVAQDEVADQTFDAGSLSAPTLALMDNYQRGITVNLGDGNDTVTGSAYGDSIAMGAGTDMIDGGANLGTPPGGGGKAIDTLEVYVADQAHADALAVSTLDANSTGADADAFTGGYSFKVVNGSGVAYVKHIEQIYVRLAETREFIKSIALAVSVHEIAHPSSDQLADYVHYAWAQGTERDDSFNAASDISSDTQTLMNSHGRGVYIDTGAGNDTVTGSAFGDNIIAGSGTNYVDGGANGGAAPSGGMAEDVLQVMVANQADADAVQVIALSTSSGSADDMQAATDGYAYKVINAAAGESDYIKNIEKVTVLLTGVSGSAAVAREIALAVSVREADLSGDTSSNHQLAWVKGTGHADAIDLSGDSALLSSAVKTEMAASKRGVWVDGGNGDDIITGTAYADVFRNGAGNDKIDGGANDAAGGKHGQDVFEIQIANQTEMDAVQVSVSDDVHYTWKVSYGTGQVDYLKNVEAITVFAATGGASKTIPLAVTVTEIVDTTAPSLDSATHYAWATGTALGDTFNAATDISTATATLMSAHGRGVYVDLGAGNDTIVGSGYGDYLIAGAGINHIDGGANAGTTPSGIAAQDVLQVTVADQAAADALQVTALSTGSGSVDDKVAAAHGYGYKIVNAASGETDYVMHVESVNVMIAGTSGGAATFARAIALQAGPSDVLSNTAPTFSSLGGTLDTTGVTPMLIDSDATVFDANLAGDSYQGAHLMLARHGGASADDVFGTSGEVSISGTDIKVGTVVVGTVTLAGGSLDIAFNDMANQSMVNSVMQSLSYANHSATSPASVTIDWTFSDGNSGGQGAGGAMSASGSSTFNIGTQYSALSANQVSDSTMYLATFEGTARVDTVNAAALVSSATAALIEQYHKGIELNLAGGDDSVTGTAYGDLINLGSGTNHADGSSGLDVVRVVVNSQDEANAVAITDLDIHATGADAAAFADGYTRKLVNGTDVDYLKNIEKIDIRFADMTPARQIEFVRLEENTDQDHFAKLFGSSGGDSIDVAHDVSPATLALMAAHQTGVFMNMGAGDDIVTGSAYGDNFEAGAGTKMIDGGANLGLASAAYDSVTVYVPTQEIANAASATVLDGAGSVADNAAFAAGYGFKLVAGNTVDYVKNVEKAYVITWDDADTNGTIDNGEAVNYGSAREIRLGVTVNETMVDPGNAGHALYSGVLLANEWRLAWADGTAGGDNFDVANNISATSRALMDTYEHGVRVDLGAGNDSAVGSAYGDSFDLGSGTNYVDGGSNLGHAPGQITIAADELDLYVTTPEAAAALVPTVLDGTGSATDKAAFNAGFAFKIVTSDAIDYIKNVEIAHVSVWNDANNNGLRDGGEMSWNKDLSLGLRVDEVTLKEGDPLHTWWGGALGDVDKWATANGADGADVFDAGKDVSSITRALMDSTGHGIYAEMRGGDDTVVGSKYADEISLGSGTNHVDGGTGKDMLRLYLPDQATVDAMTFTTLRSTSTGADAAAFAAGYQYKLVAGSETDYMVNIETVDVWIWKDNDHNGQRQWGDGGEMTYGKTIDMLPRIEQQVDQNAPTKTPWGTDLAGREYFALVQGGPAGDHFNAHTDLSATTQGAMLQYGRGVEVRVGDGDNVIVGSDYSDYFQTGHGINRIDGGTNVGAKPNGDSGDLLELWTTSVDAGNAIVPIALTGTLTGEDALAQAQGYRFKFVSGDQTDYVKNVEHVVVWAWDDKNANGLIDWGNAEVSYVKPIDIDTSGDNAPVQISLVGTPVGIDVGHLG